MTLNVEMCIETNVYLNELTLLLRFNEGGQQKKYTCMSFSSFKRIIIIKKLAQLCYVFIIKQKMLFILIATFKKKHA